MVRSVRIDGEKFAALVQRRLMSQKAFADAGGLGPSTVFRLSRPGVHGMLVNRFRQLAAALGMTPEDLRAQIGAKGEPAPPPPNVSPATALADFVAAESARLRISAEQVLAQMVAHFASLTQNQRRDILARAPADARMRLAASPMGPRPGKPGQKSN